MAEFYNPYQFINAQKVSDVLTPFSEIKAGGEQPVRHDRWEKDSRSGRIICQLNTITPIMVGGKHNVVDENIQATYVDNYRLPQNENGHLAIPANTLRGMIASVAEIISDSTMRVLSNNKYSVRKDMSNGLSAIGQVTKDDDGNFFILPLALVTAPLNNNIIDFSKWKTIFYDSPLDECLAAYVGVYPNEKKGLLKEGVCGKKLTDWCSYNPENPEYVYVKPNDEIQALNMTMRVDKSSHHKSLHFTSRGKCMLAGQKLYGRTEIMSDKSLSEDDKKYYKRGILYVLGKHIDSKKHELFIPYGKDLLKKRKLLSLPDSVVNTFNTIANERHDADSSFPHVPQGHVKTKDDNSKKINFISEGDIIYFDFDEESKIISEISFSSIWRSSINNKTHDYFKNNSQGNVNILPWCGEGRDSLTPAEALFGVVDSGSEGQNLASRINFYDALSSTQDVDLLDEVTLKILNTPKPPSPAMYFHKKGQGQVNKQTLNNEGVFPNGRKRYLHHRQADVDLEVWKSISPQNFSNQKIRCTPINKDQKFYFHIDFNNLSDDEIGLLLTAIEPNIKQDDTSSGKHFWHKIGMGKPLGLGSVNVQVAGVFLVDREKRYTSKEIESVRYAAVQNSNILNWPDIKARYPVEFEMKDSPVKAIKYFSFTLINDDAYNSLFSLGCRESLDIKLPVCYPYSESQKPYNEEKGFQWFTDRNLKQTLGYATASNIPLLRPSSSVCNSNSNNINVNCKKEKNTSDDKKDDLCMKNIPCFNSEQEKNEWILELNEVLGVYGVIREPKIITPKNGNISTIGFVSFNIDDSRVVAQKAISDGFVKVNGRKIYLSKPR